MCSGMNQRAPNKRCVPDNFRLWKWILGSAISSIFCCIYIGVCFTFTNDPLQLDFAVNFSSFPEISMNTHWKCSLNRYQGNGIKTKIKVKVGTAQSTPLYPLSYTYRLLPILIQFMCWHSLFRRFDVVSQISWSSSLVVTLLWILSAWYVNV